jgi:transposase InsO family protein
MAKGFLYLVVIMDWVSRAVLAWRLSNTLGAEFCVDALEDALARHGQPTGTSRHPMPVSAVPRVSGERSEGAKLLAALRPATS